MFSYVSWTDTISKFRYVEEEDGIPADALLAEDGSALLAEDGTTLLSE